MFCKLLGDVGHNFYYIPQKGSNFCLGNPFKHFSIILHVKQGQQAVVHDVENFTYTRKKERENKNTSWQNSNSQLDTSCYCIQTKLLFYAISKEIKKILGTQIQSIILYQLNKLVFCGKFVFEIKMHMKTYLWRSHWYLLIHFLRDS